LCEKNFQKKSRPVFSAGELHRIPARGIAKIPTIVNSGDPKTFGFSRCSPFQGSRFENPYGFSFSSSPGTHYPKPPFFSFKVL
jgi:hypothetical protein